jgi:hypothetical protein
MNKEKRILVVSFFVVIMLIVLFPQIGGHIQQQVSSGVTEDNKGDGGIEIIDISFEGMKIIATIKSLDVGQRTIQVNFYKSRIIGGNPTDPMLIGSKLGSIKPGETIYVSKIWLGFGHCIIQVELMGFDEASQELWWFLFFGGKVN